jgi:hypothetical protein
MHKFNYFQCYLLVTFLILLVTFGITFYFNKHLVYNYNYKYTQLKHISSNEEDENLL